MPDGIAFEAGENLRDGLGWGGGTYDGRPIQGGAASVFGPLLVEEVAVVG